jgi:hypothetical protein
MKHIIERFLKMTTEEVLNTFSELPGAIKTRNYVFIQGIRDKPILLVGHADTVFTGPPGSVEWCGNIAKAGYSWSSKSNTSSTASPVKHAAACSCSTCVKERDAKMPLKAKTSIVHPVTNIITPATGLETVKSFATANGYTIHYLPDMRFARGDRSLTYDEFVRANMATMFKQGKIPKDIPVGESNLTREDVKVFAASRSYIPFYKKGDVRGGDLMFMRPGSSRDTVSFETFCKENAAELLALKDKKNGISMTGHVHPVRRGTYSTQERRKVEDAINLLPDEAHRKLVRKVVDDMERDGLLVTPEEISLAKERWEKMAAEKALATLAAIDVAHPYAEADPDVNGVKAAKELQESFKKGVEIANKAKEDNASKFEDEGYKGFSKDDVIAFAKDLGFHTVTQYKAVVNTHSINFHRGETLYTWKGFCDFFSFGIEFERDKRLNAHPDRMWPFGNDKEGKAREDLMKKFAKEHGWDSDFSDGMRFNKKGDKEKISLHEFILRHVNDLQIEMSKLDEEFKNEAERSVSKNALKKVTKLADRLKAVVDAAAGTVTTKDGTVHTIHGFREQYDTKYAASLGKKLPISTTTSIVKSNNTTAGYSKATGGYGGDDDWGYGYHGGTASSSYGSGRGLGADDRVGIAMIWMMRKSGHSILITEGEERGGIGAKAASREMAETLSKHQFAIEN